MYDPALTTFLAVADCNSFTKASDRLFLSLTAVMKQMNGLEGRLGVKLFDCRPQGCTLTPGGQVMYRYAKQVIDISDKAIQEAHEAEGRVQRVFRIGTSILNPAMPFLDIWKRVSDDFPGFDLEMIPFDDDHSDIMSEVSQIGRKFDVFMGVSDSVGWNQHVDMVQTTTMQKDIVTREDLHGRTLIMVGAGDSPTNDAIRDDLRTNDPEIVIKDAPIHYDMSVYNDAVSTKSVLLNNECWANVHPMLKTIPVDWDYTIPFGLLYAKRPAPHVQRLVNDVKRLVEEK